MYEFLLAVHILAAVLWVGGGVTVNILGWLARKEGGERLVSFSRQANWLAPRFYAPLALILLLAGFLLVDEAGYELGDLFISLALLGWLISFVLGMAFYPSQQRKLEAAVAQDGTDAPAVGQVVDRVLQVNAAEQLILLLVVIDMAVKPGL